jgi:hypothetical protein
MGEQFGSSTVTPENAVQVRAFIEKGLAERLDQLPGFAGNYRLVPGSVRLPWERLFEVDFDLETR